MYYIRRVFYLSFDSDESDKENEYSFIEIKGKTTDKVGNVGMTYWKDDNVAY